MRLVRPWARGNVEIFGPYGVGKPGREGYKSLKGYLADYVDARLVTDRKTSSSADGGGAPSIWSTEFGYYNYNGSKLRPGMTKKTKRSPATEKPSAIHSEVERVKWLKGSGGSGGAFEQLRARGGAEVLALYNVFERPPVALAEGAAGRFDDLGFIGGNFQLTMLGVPPSEPDRDYQGQLFAVNSPRPYGLRGSSNVYDLAAKPQRTFGCAVRRWVLAHGTANAKRLAKTTDVPAGAQRCP